MTILPSVNAMFVALAVRAAPDAVPDASYWPISAGYCHHEQPHLFYCVSMTSSNAANKPHAACSEAVPAGSQRPPMTKSDSATGLRLIAGVIFAASLGLIVVAALLEPASRGVGTHQSMGLPPCGMMEYAGMPCATCGMTTSFAYAADGRLWTAFINQPAGALLALATAMTALISGYAMVLGLSLGPLVGVVMRARTIWIGGAIFLLSWVYKIMLVKGVF